MITFMDATEGGEQTRGTEECAFTLRGATVVLNQFPCPRFVHTYAALMPKQWKSKNQLEKDHKANLERMSKFNQKKSEEQAVKDSLARQQALEQLGITQEFNHLDHAKIYSYADQAVAAPIETVDSSIPPPEVTYETLDEGRLPQAPTEEPIILRRLKPLGSKRAFRQLRLRRGSNRGAHHYY